MESRDEEAVEISKPPLTVLLASPRGFCAGVERAVRIVELALAKYGAPIYARHEIVHNRFVVDRLKALGAVFIDKLADAPDGARVIFSAHGVPKSVRDEAASRKQICLDATCPLVSKVHVEAEHLCRAGYQVILIGHAGHPEVEGTLGQLPEGAITLISTLADAAALRPTDPARLAYVTQTTLSVDDTADIVAVLRSRFPKIVAPRKEDICYATTNRQDALKAIAWRADGVLVVGAPHSSNSQRLVDVALRAGAKWAQLIQSAAEIDWPALINAKIVALTAGASAPEFLVRDVVEALRARFRVDLIETSTVDEAVSFNVPRALAS